MRVHAESSGSSPARPPSAPSTLAFDALSDDEAFTSAYACVAVRRWAQDLVDGRPYGSWPLLREAAERAASELSEGELDEALAGHPRIGERPGAGHAAAHSEREQSAVDARDDETAALLAAGNAAYEERFGRVFIIRAAGRGAPEILAALERRLASSEPDERRETVAQLREIALLRLERMVS